MHPPFESFKSVPIRELTLKVLFLVAITSTRWIPELGELSVHPRLCIFHKDIVVLCTYPSFVPTVNMPFHRAQELILPNFCPNPSHPREKLCHTLDVRRSIRLYHRRTRDLRRSKALFVTFKGSNRGHKASSSSARWLKACIVLAYQSAGESPPDGITEAMALPQKHCYLNRLQQVHLLT